MNLHTLIGFSVVAGLTILSPGPAVLLTLRNGAHFGVRSVAWSALGIISGVFCVATASILGLGVVLNSSAWLFAAVKVLGAVYLFYIGARHLLNASVLMPAVRTDTNAAQQPAPHHLYREALLTSATNPKALVFFTALFPQFIHTQEPLLPQFLILTGLFMGLSYLTHLMYAALASRIGRWFANGVYARWLNRLIGIAFVGFGTMVLLVPRQVL